MVCHRCIYAVQQIFEHHNITISQIKLGEVHTKENLAHTTLLTIEQHLNKIGFEIIEDQSLQLVEQIKIALIQEISQENIAEDFSLSRFISSHFHRDYSALSKLFSQIENTTLEHFFIAQKIEKAKELLIYNQLTLTEISIKLGYKTVQHLSSQFKNSTGFSPTEFKKLKSHNRLALDKI